MRNAFFLLVILVALCNTSAAQCTPPDTTVFGAGVHHITAPSASTLNCWQTNCLGSPLVSYAIDIVVPDSINAIEFGTEVLTNSHFAVLVDSCRFSVYDTCGQWWAPDGDYLMDTLITGSTFRINVSTDNSSMLGFYILVTPTPSAPIPSWMACQTTSCGGIKPQHEPCPIFLRFDTWQIESRRPLPSGLFYEVNETFVGRGRIIRRE